MRIRLLTVAVAASLLAACGDDNNSSSTTQTGYFLDAAVSGLSYKGSSNSGTTGASGEFRYAPGETITFSLGGVVIGSAKGGDKVLLKDLDNGVDSGGLPSNVSINRAIFLQTIDEDHDASNGIQISSATRDLLKSAVISFNTDSTNFTTALATALSTAGITATPVPADEALDHLRQTEAETKGFLKTSVQDGVVDSIQRFVLPDSYVPYPGTNAGIKKLFPKGFPLAVGSGIAFSGKSGDTLTFYSITDRGPNADSPALLPTSAPVLTKVFPAPDFAPTVVKLTVDTTGSKGVVVSDAHELRRNGNKISGRPVESGVGSSTEVALDETLTHKLAFDPEGMDTEAIVKDPDGTHAWICDEYGPFVAKIELATGNIVRKYQPGTELPAVIAKRQPNRGCEGLAMTPNGKLYAMVQSTLDVPDASNKSVKDTALFTRIVEIDKSGNEAAPVTRTFAYPIAPADWDGGKAGKAKLGDLVAIDNTHFLIIEQGAFKDGKIHNKIFLVDISGATDISAMKNGALELETVTTPAGLVTAGVTTAKKYLVGDLRDYGWMLEKTEGLALVDNQTLALINDDDFGLAADAEDASGNAVDATKLFVDTATGAVTDSKGVGGYSYAVGSNPASQRRTQLWLIKLAKPVLDFQKGYGYAQAGDLLNAPLKDFHPTQPAIGYDQIYYKLGRYARNLDTPNKKYDDYCEDMGQDSATKASVTGTSHLNDATSFSCKDPLGKTLTKMKSAVIGPEGKLYLTDGHHSFTSYYETPDGGQDMKVWVRVLANFSNSKSMDDFWAKMKANNYVWLKDGSNNNATITTDQLPARLGLANGLHNDPYRSLIYFTRDIAYSQPAGGTEFLEFYWEDWIRAQASLSGITAQMTDFSTYLTAVQTTSNAMVAIADGSVVSGGKTTTDLGKLAAFSTSEYTKLSKPITDSKPGKLSYALDYKASLAP
jgi:hypothetical protein